MRPPRGITSGGYFVSEVFGEIRVPLLADKTFADVLALEGAVRYSDYSNFGPWVEVYALGSDVVNAYPNGSYTYKEPPRSGPPPETATFTNGMACSFGLGTRP